MLFCHDMPLEMAKAKKDVSHFALVARRDAQLLCAMLMPDSFRRLLIHEIDASFLFSSLF